MSTKPKYGNWIPKRMIYIFGFFGLLFLGLSVLFLFLLILAVPFLILSLYFLYARYKFSLEGGNVQDGVWNLVLANLGWDGQGKALDIGCGNGALTIKMAKKYPDANVTGIDFWGKKWEYSENTCERNAEIEGVHERITFQKASAVSLPFEDGYFDAAVSNFVFHEVSDAKDKSELIREALRVVKKGGKFSFQDEFLIKQVYGDIDVLVENIKSWGVSKVEFVNTRDADFIPKALKLPFILGSMGIIHGEK